MATNSKPSSTELADLLRDDILAGRLQAGTRLTEAELSERFEVGRGRVREAIQQLARQGLLLVRPNRGATVAPEAPKAVEDHIISLRRSLELFALESVFPRLQEKAFKRWEAILDDMKKACDEHNYHDIAEADLAFHRALFEEAELPDLLIIWETVIGRIRSHFLRMQWRTPRLVDIWDEHRQLLKTFRTGDFKAASQLLGAKIE
jgi:DNA-binding GntR family transcriptional regulator